MAAVCTDMIDFTCRLAVVKFPTTPQRHPLLCHFCEFITLWTLEESQYAMSLQGSPAGQSILICVKHTVAS